MFRHLAVFEFRYQVRQPLYWGTAAVFATMSFVATVTDAFQLGARTGARGALEESAGVVLGIQTGHAALEIIG